MWVKECINADSTAYHFTTTTAFISNSNPFGFLFKEEKKKNSEKVKLTLLTQILHYIPDVRDEVVEPVALSGGRQVRFAVASHIHSHHTELALKLPQLVPPREPDEEMRVSHTPHGERTSLITWLPGHYGFIMDHVHYGYLIIMYPRIMHLYSSWQYDNLHTMTHYHNVLVRSQLFLYKAFVNILICCELKI